MINIFTPGAGIRLFALTRTVARYGERLVSHSATFRLLTDLRMHVFEKLLGQDEAQLRRLQRSDIRSRLSADIDNLDHLYLGVANPGLGALLATALTLIGISLLTPMLALICAGLFLLLNPTIALTCLHLGARPERSTGKCTARIAQPGQRRTGSAPGTGRAGPARCNDRTYRPGTLNASTPFNNESPSLTPSVMVVFCWSV